MLDHGCNRRDTRRALAGIGAVCLVAAATALFLPACSEGGGGGGGSGSSGSTGAASGQIVLTDARQVILCDGTRIDVFTLSILGVEVQDSTGAWQTVYPTSSSTGAFAVDLLDLDNVGDVLGQFLIPAPAPAIIALRLTLDGAANSVTVASGSPNYAAGTVLPLDTSALPAAPGGAGAVQAEVRLRPPISLRTNAATPVILDMRPRESILCQPSATGGATTYAFQPDLRIFTLGAPGFAVRASPARVDAVDCAAGAETLNVVIDPARRTIFQVSIAAALAAGEVRDPTGAPIGCADLQAGDHVLIRGQLQANGTIDASGVVRLPARGGPGGGPGGPGSGGGGHGRGQGAPGPVPAHPAGFAGLLSNLVTSTTMDATFDLAPPSGGPVVHVVISSATTIRDGRPGAGPGPFDTTILGVGQLVRVRGTFDPATQTFSPTVEAEVRR